MGWRPDRVADCRRAAMASLRHKEYIMNRLNATKNIAGPISNQRGGVIGIIVLFLALIGAWYLYQSYTRGQVRTNLKAITGDYEHGIKKIITPVK